MRNSFLIFPIHLCLFLSLDGWGIKLLTITKIYQYYKRFNIRDKTYDYISQLKYSISNIKDVLDQLTLFNQIIIFPEEFDFNVENIKC